MSVSHREFTIQYSAWQNERGQQGRQSQLASDQIENPSEVRMAKEKQYPDSTGQDNSAQSSNWKSIGSLAADAVRKAAERANG